MKRFYKEVLYSIFAIFALNLVVFYVIINPEVYNPYKISDKDLNNNLIFSDSHGWSLTNNNQARKKMLHEHNISNLSYGSDSYFDIYFKLGFLISKGHKIDTIYLTADPHMLGKKRVDNNNRNRSIRYASYQDYKSFFKISYPEFIFKKYIRKYVSTFDINNSKLIQVYIESKLSNSKEKAYTNWENLEQVEKIRRSKNRFIDFYQKGVSPKQQKVLKDILKLCDSYNIELIFIKFPNAPALEQIKMPESFKKAAKIFENKNHRVINIHNLNDDYFENQDHVNAKGAMYIINTITSLK